LYRWTGFTDEQLVRWGNLPIRIIRADGTREQTHVHSWDFHPSGRTIILKRRIVPVIKGIDHLPEDAALFAIWRLEPATSTIETLAMSYDAEELKRQLDEAQRAKTLQRLSLPPEAGLGSGRP
jgi:hypothetical protein